jgi:hypothetical protein
MLEQTIRRSQNRAIEAAQVIEELIALASDMREANARGEAMGLTEDELAFYDALETNASAVKVLGDETPRAIARELVETGSAKNVFIDWTLWEIVRAQLRVLVKGILRKYGSPPDKQEKATQAVGRRRCCRRGGRWPPEEVHRPAPPVAASPTQAYTQAPPSGSSRMSRYTRAEFLNLAALAVGDLVLRPAAKPAPHRPIAFSPFRPAYRPELILLNGRIVTIDDTLPRAEAFAVEQGRFIAVGSNAEIRALATRTTTVFDAGGLTVVPGFIDCHCHPRGVNELFGVNANLRSIAELQDAIRKKAAETPPGFWVEAWMFDDTKLRDPRPLHRTDLDAATSQHPVAVNHRGGHTGWYNSKALELAGITRDTPDPDHGRYFRDETGELTGRVAERAREVFARVGQREQFTEEAQRERNRAGMRHISKLLTATGLTTVHDAGASSEAIRAYQDIYQAAELRHRAYLMVRGPFRQLRQAGVTTGLGDDQLRIGGVKYTADGSASERTMRMSTPYVGTDDYGILTMTQQEIHEAVEEAHRAGWQVGIHANGDVTIDMVLQAYERVLRLWPHPDRRHRIEHCTLVNPDLLRRIKATGSIPTPFWTYVYYHGEKWSQYGDEKLRWMFAHRSFLDTGIPVPGASDYGPGPFEPLMAIQSMVTRTDYRGREWGPNQKVTVDEALRIATIHGARASYEEHLKGSISVGKLADFVILGRDPHDVPPTEILAIPVLRTVVGGRTVHER